MRGYFYIVKVYGYTSKTFDTVIAAPLILRSEPEFCSPFIATIFNISHNVSLSNKLDKEVDWRKPGEGTHRKVVGASVMDSELFLKVSQREERVDRIKAFLIFPVAAFHLTIMSGSVRANQFMLDTQLSGGFLKKGLNIPFTVGKTVCKFKTVVGLNTFHTDTPAGIPLDQAFQKVGGGIGRLLRIGGQETEPGELVNGGILEQAQLRVSNAAAGNDLYIHLDSFSRTSHLLVRFWCVSLFLLLLWEHHQLTHDPEQALGSAGVAALLQAVPQLHQAKLWIAAAHIPDELQFRFGMLVWMAVRTPGLASQRCHTPIPAGTPKVNIRPALVVLPAGSADAILLRVFH